jgi:hypothetical protein
MRSIYLGLNTENQNRDESDVNEQNGENIGLFLEKILLKFRTAHNLILEECLMITSIISTLAYLPVESLYCLLFSPNVNNGENEMRQYSLLVSLRDLVCEVEKKAKSVDGFVELARQAREEMDGGGVDVLKEERSGDLEWVKVCLVFSFSHILISNLHFYFHIFNFQFSIFCILHPI